MKVLVRKQWGDLQPDAGSARRLGADFEQTRRTALPAEALLGDFEAQGPEAAQAVMDAHGISPELPGTSPPGWGSLVPDVAPPIPTAMGRDVEPLRSERGFHTRADVYPQFAEKYGDQEWEHLALTHALSELGYPLLPETPVFTPNTRILRTRQPRVDILGDEGFEPWEHYDPHYDMDMVLPEEWTDLGRRYRRFSEGLERQNPLTELLGLWDLGNKVENVGVLPSGDLVGVDPHYYDSGTSKEAVGFRNALGRILSGRSGISSGRLSPITPSSLEDTSRPVKEALAKIPHGELSRVREALPPEEFFSPWMRQAEGLREMGRESDDPFNFHDFEADRIADNMMDYQNWRSKMSNWLHLLESLQEHPQQRRVYDYMI